MTNANTKTLKRWSNGLGFDFGEWELVKLADGSWSAALKPAWFGGTVKIGRAATYLEAIRTAHPTEDFSIFMARANTRAARSAR